MQIISKELLSEVLKKEVFNVACISADGKDVCYNYTEYEDEILSKLGEAEQINIYELADKCKKWASKGGANIWSWPNNAEIRDIHNFYEKSFRADSEQEAIFKACEWIREKIK